MSDRLLVIPVPPALDTEYLVMGVPLREIGIFGLGPIGLAAVVKTFELDVTLPFPLFGGILFSNFILWICGPAGFLALRHWKRRNPDVALADALSSAFGRRSWAASPRDLEFQPYLVDPLPWRFDPPPPGSWRDTEDSDAGFA